MSARTHGTVWAQTSPPAGDFLMQCVPSQEVSAQLGLPPAAVVCVQPPLLAAGQVQVSRV